MRDMVTFPQIEEILEILDDRDISRELIEIPLGCQDPGSVTRLASGKVRVVVAETGPFEDWLAQNEAAILEALGHSE
jgi:hypothetical protein